MSNRSIDTETRTIHPKALAKMGAEGCMIALGVARDMRSGAIPPEKYVQSHLWCGTKGCILGHMRERGYGVVNLLGSDLFMRFPIGFEVQPTPAQAADAIERYIYDGAERCWEDVRC